MALLALRRRAMEKKLELENCEPSPDAGSGEWRPCTREEDGLSTTLSQICAKLDQIQNQNIFFRGQIQNQNLDVLEMKMHMKEMAVNQAEFENKIMSQINVTLRHFKDDQVKSNTQHFKNITDQLSEAHQENLDSSTVILTKMTEEVDKDALFNMLSDNRDLLIQLRESAKGYHSTVSDVQAKLQKHESQLTQVAADQINISESSNQLGAELGTIKESSNQLGVDLANIKESSNKFEADLTTIRELSNKFFIDQAQIKESCNQFRADLATMKETSNQFGVDIATIKQLSNQSLIDQATIKVSYDRIGADLASVNGSLRINDRNENLKRLSERLEAMIFKLDKYVEAVEIVPDKVKEVTREHLIWFNKQIEKKLESTVMDSQETFKHVNEIYKKVDSMLTRISTFSEEILSHKSNNGNQISAGRQEMQGMAKPYFVQDINNVLSALEKLRVHVDDKIEVFGNETVDCLKQFDTLHNLNKRFTQISELTKELKAMMERQTTSLDTGACWTQLFDTVNTIIPDVHQHFQVNIQQEWRTLSDLISRKLTDATDATQTLSNVTVAYTDELLKQTKGNSSALRREVSCIAEASNDIFASIVSLQENMEAIQNQVKDVETTVKTIQTNVNSLETTVKEKICLLTKKQSEAMEKQEKYFSEVKDFIERTKHEIFAMSEKEAQLVRDRFIGPLPSPGKYTFDFYVSEFRSLVRTGKILRSTPWYMNEIKSCVSGCVSFSPDGKMEVSLVHGRNPYMVGLKPVSCKLILKVTATICDIQNRTLPDVPIFQKVKWYPDEASILGPIHAGWDTKVGTMPCDYLLEKGYGDKEGYHHAAVLIRYDVIVDSGVS